MKISENENFFPRWVSPPGETISEILSEKGLDEESFAKELGFSNARAKALIRGEMALTLQIASQLEQHVGGTKDFWLVN